MTLARRCGLEAPRTELLHLPEPVYLVHRYDRRPVGGQVRRRHQIDLCQLLGKWPGYKYEEDGGASLAETFDALRHVRQPAVARLAMLRWVIFDYLIGNSDAHAKNVSFLVGRHGIDLAPAYDLLSVRACGADHDHMAMSIGEEVRYGQVGAEQWRAFITAVGIGARLLWRLLGELAEQVPAEACAVAESPDFTTDEQAFLEAQVLPVLERHAGYAREALGR